MDKLIEVFKLSKPQTDINLLLKSTDLYGQGLIDSFDILIIMDEICIAYGIAINGADLHREDFKTMNSLYAMIKRFTKED